MNLPLSLTAPEALQGTAGTYLLYAKGNGNKLFVNTEIAPCIGRKDGQSYNAYGLVFRMLFAGDDPKVVPGLELRDKKAYKYVGKADGDDVYAQQLNKMLFPIATVNVGTTGLVEHLAFHFEVLTDLLSPLLETNALVAVQELGMIFEAQNSQMFVPPVMFAPPQDLLTWEESVANVKAAAAAKYTPKNKDYGDAD